MIKMSNKARVAAERLAVCYAAYRAARDSYDDNGICVWGTMLIETQTELGIDLADANNVARLITSARKRMSEIK